jgi:hypothetical protein
MQKQNALLSMFLKRYIILEVAILSLISNTKQERNLSAVLLK